MTNDHKRYSSTIVTKVTVLKNSVAPLHTRSTCTRTVQCNSICSLYYYVTYMNTYLFSIVHCTVYTNTGSILSEIYLSSLRFESCRLDDADSQVSPHKVTLERETRTLVMT